MTISRRNFVQLIGTAAMSSSGVSSSLPYAPRADRAAKFLYAGTATHAVDVFALQKGRYKKLQEIHAKAPVSMTIAPNKRTLYVVNEIASYHGLPRGTVESYRIAEDGTLSLQHIQELSLAATMPQHVALAQDGRSMIVSAGGGGIINILPIGEDGSPGRPSSIFKVTGDVRGRRSRPTSASFDRSGRALCVDQGTGCVSVLEPAQDGLLTHTRVMTASDDSPVGIALHLQTDSLYISHRSSLEHYAYDHTTGQIGALKNRYAGMGDGDSGALTVHPSGFLYACDRQHGIAAWRIHPNGALSFTGRTAPELGPVSAVQFATDGGSVVAMSEERGLLGYADIEAQTGRFGRMEFIARVSSPRSLAVIFQS